MEMAWSEGMVQGVVVQMMKSAGPSKDSRPAGLEVISKRTKMEGDVSSPYSISASARAVWQCLHQCTGLWPR